MHMLASFFLLLVEVTEEEYSGYGTYHFFTLFLLAVVVAIACYCGLANRKKVRTLVIQVQISDFISILSN